MQANPDHILSLSQFPRIALEQSTPSGGKFWLGVPMESGVSIRWGKLGTRGTVKHIARSKCRDRNVARELLSRVLEKLHHGYNLIPYETVLP